MKYIVDHTGICEGVNFVKDVPVELPDAAVMALGEHAKPVNVKDEKPQPSKIKRVLKKKLAGKKIANEDLMTGRVAGSGPQVISSDE